MKIELDQKFLRIQKSILLKEKGRLKKEITKTEQFPQYGSSDEDNTSEVAEFTAQQGLEKNLRIMLKDVEEALRRMEGEKYGVCKKCKKPIHKNRLKAFPAATICSQCAQ